MGQPKSNKCMNLSSSITLGQDFRDLAEIEESSPEKAHIGAYWDLKNYSKKPHGVNGDQGNAIQSIPLG